MQQGIADGFKDIATAIEPYIKAYGTYSSALIIGGKIVSKTINFAKGVAKRQYYDINEIFNEFISEEIQIGDLIETSGYLLRYGQVFKPYTHISAMFSNCKKGEEKRVLKGGKLITECSMIMSSKIFQPPVQKIPAHNGIGCAFLYDYRFTGFLHKGNENKEEQKDKPILIDEYCKPIMILYDTAKQEKYINKEVHIKGRLINLPSDLARNLNGIFDNSIREICSNFLRPYNENANFICISLLDGECDVKEIAKIDGIETFGAPLYVETQVEGLGGISKEQAQKMIESILPNLPQKLDPSFPITVGTFANNIGTPFLSINNINVIFREPEIIGFYTETAIFNQAEYNKCLEDFTTFINNFSIDYRQKSKKQLGGKFETKLNFLFDYDKQFLFDKRGALNSDYAKHLYESDEPARYVIDWLKNEI